VGIYPIVVAEGWRTIEESVEQPLVFLPDLLLLGHPLLLPTRSQVIDFLVDLQVLWHLLYWALAFQIL